MAVHIYHKVELGGRYMSSYPGAHESLEDSVNTVLYKCILLSVELSQALGLGLVLQQ